MLKMKNFQKIARKWIFLSLAFYNAPSLHTADSKLTLHANFCVCARMCVDLTCALLQAATADEIEPDIRLSYASKQPNPVIEATAIGIVPDSLLPPTWKVVDLGIPRVASTALAGT